MICYDLARDEIGGVQNRANRFLQGLIKSKIIKDIIIFNLYKTTPCILTSCKIKLYNYNSEILLSKSLSRYILSSSIDILYFIDYRHINPVYYDICKNRPRRVIASVPDIDQYRSKFVLSSTKKIKLEQKLFTRLSSACIDYLHVSCDAQRLIANKYFSTDIDYIMSPIGLFKDKYNLYKNNIYSAIVASRNTPFKCVDNTISVLNSSDLINQIYFITDNDNLASHLNKQVIISHANKYEDILKYYKLAQFNIDLTYIETFANTLVEGGFYGAIPVISPTNFVTFDLFGGNVIYATELDIIKNIDIPRLSKHVFNYSRQKFDILKNTKEILMELK